MVDQGEWGVGAHPGRCHPPTIRVVSRDFSSRICGRTVTGAHRLARAARRGGDQGSPDASRPPRPRRQRRRLFLSPGARGEHGQGATAPAPRQYASTPAPPRGQGAPAPAPPPPRHLPPPRGQGAPRTTAPPEPADHEQGRE
eukprot:1189904-Prorocentrum_minimum.AAC.1